MALFVLFTRYLLFCLHSTTSPSRERGWTGCKTDLTLQMAVKDESCWVMCHVCKAVSLCRGRSEVRSMGWMNCARARTCSSTSWCARPSLCFIFIFSKQVQHTEARNAVLPHFTRYKVNAASKVESDKRISLVFRSSQYLPQTLLGRDVSATLPPFTINLPQLPGAGWVDTTYVDDDIRVARAFGGNLFVLARV